MLLAHTRPGQTVPDEKGFQVALIAAAVLCLATAVVSYLLPGRSPPSSALTVDERKNLEMLMKDDAELSGTGLVASEEPPPSRYEEARP